MSREFNFWGRRLPKTPALRTTKPAVDVATHHKILIKEPGENLVALRTELADPFHAELVAYAQQGENFSQCIARIATFIDIALDGEYDADILCGFLATCLRNKRMGIKEAHKLHPALINAELEEHEDEVRLVKKD